MVPLCLLVSGTKYSYTLLINLSFFYVFIIIIDWYDSHGQVYKILKETYLHRLGHTISYYVVCVVPLYIKFLLTDTVSYEKEMNVDVLGTLAIWWLPIIIQENGALVVLVNNSLHELVSLSFHKVPCLAYSHHAVADCKNIWFSWTAGF